MHLGAVRTLAIRAVSAPLHPQWFKAKTRANSEADSKIVSIVESGAAAVRATLFVGYARVSECVRSAFGETSRI